MTPNLHQMITEPDKQLIETLTTLALQETIRRFLHPSDEPNRLFQEASRKLKDRLQRGLVVHPLKGKRVGFAIGNGTPWDHSDRRRAKPQLRSSKARLLKSIRAPRSRLPKDHPAREEGLTLDAFKLMEILFRDPGYYQKHRAGYLRRTRELRAKLAQMAAEGSIPAKWAHADPLGQGYVMGTPEYKAAQKGLEVIPESERKPPSPKGGRPRKYRPKAEPTK
jgi:hypothetical protein